MDQNVTVDVANVRRVRKRLCIKKKEFQNWKAVVGAVSYIANIKTWTSTAQLYIFRGCINEKIDGVPS